MRFEVGDYVEHSRSPGTFWRITRIAGSDSEKSADLKNMWGEYLAEMDHVSGPVPDEAAISSIFSIDDWAIIDELEHLDPLYVLALEAQ